MFFGGECRKNSTHIPKLVKRKVYMKRGNTPQTERGLLSEAKSERDSERDGVKALRGTWKGSEGGQ